MVTKGDPNAPRGPGEDRFNRMLRLKPPERLEDGKHMVFDHALRCYCKQCGGLLNWDSLHDVSYTESECCGFRYRLQPKTVIVHIDDVSERPILPKMEGSLFADPSLSLDDSVVGKTDVVGMFSRPLSAAQLDLNWAAPIGRPVPPQKLRQEAESSVAGRSDSVRKCGVCRQPGHTKRRCPGG